MTVTNYSAPGVIFVSLQNKRQQDMKQRIYPLLFVVVATLFLVSPTQAQSQTDIIDGFAVD